MAKVTIETVAEYAGVSKATVSYVMSGKGKISPEVIERVRQAISDLGYRPSTTARNLARRVTKTLGLYAPPTKVIKEDLYFNELLAGVLDGCHVHGYQIHLYADYLSEPFPVPESLEMTQPIDGALIMYPRSDTAYLDHIIEEGVPFVMIGTPGKNINACYVDADMVAATYLSVKALIGAGKRNLLCMCGPEGYVQARQRKEGLLKALYEEHLPPEVARIAYGDFNEQTGYRLYTSAVQAGFEPDGILTANDTMAVGAARAICERGKQIPGDVALVGEGNTLISRLHTPSLCTIDLHGYELGNQSATMLIEMIEQKRVDSRHTIIPVEFIERNSI